MTSRQNKQIAYEVNRPEDVLGAALAYSARGWPVFPVSSVDKVPLTKHGLNDATCDPELVRAWFLRWPSAICAIATGARSGVVAIDLDVGHKENVNAFVTLDLYHGINDRPITPIARTPSGGEHWLFQWPGYETRSWAGKAGPGIDFRGDGGSLTLPPGPGRQWQHVSSLRLPLARLPAWAIVAETKRELPKQFKFDECLTNYAKAALSSAINRIVGAPSGAQNATLNREAFSIGRLVGRKLIPLSDAVAALRYAGRSMPNYNPRRPWRPRDVERTIERSITEGYDAGCKWRAS